ncbi:MAG: HYExAFE family protein [Planctomycetota bacterium]|jgi:hypothetical protein
MTRRHIHYEAAFEDYLRSRGVPYVPVDEARRAIFSGAKIKSFDFLVYPGNEHHWIVDIKGRKFPYITDKGTKRYWENWVEQDDLDSLVEWQGVFGEEFEARFVFAYLLDGPPDRWPSVRPHSYRGEYYAFLAVPLADYLQHARQRSPSWQTVTVSAKTFRQIAHPVDIYGKEKQ